MKYHPRNDFVLYRMVDKGTVRGIHVPQQAAQGKEMTIVAVGPDVVGIKPGDVVMAIGAYGQDLIALPNEKDLLLTKQANIVLVVEKEEGE